MIFTTTIFTACDNTVNDRYIPTISKVTVTFDANHPNFSNQSKTFISGTVLTKNDLPDLHADGYVFQG
ncbi:MAG: hypothetical protein SPE30_07915 [Candidatus Treponema excrementipullorum]|nr:hypothetical protein [Candidatus Treponema excrementipullorum]